SRRLRRLLGWSLWRRRMRGRLWWRLWRMRRLMMVGVGYRKQLADWIDSRPSGVDCLEITAEHFYHGGQERLSDLSKRFRLFVHGLGLSLGTPGPLDKSRLEQFARVSSAANPA